MGYILCGGLYLTCSTFIGFMPLNPTSDINDAKKFSKDTFNALSNHTSGLTWVNC
jgi:hypothetical protein